MNDPIINVQIAIAQCLYKFALEAGLFELLIIEGSWLTT